MADPHQQVACGSEEAEETACSGERQAGSIQNNLWCAVKVLGSLVSLPRSRLSDRSRTRRYLSAAIVDANAGVVPSVIRRLLLGSTISVMNGTVTATMRAWTTLDRVLISDLRPNARSGLSMHLSFSHPRFCVHRRPSVSSKNSAPRKQRGFCQNLLFRNRSSCVYRISYLVKTWPPHARERP